MTINIKITHTGGERSLLIQTPGSGELQLHPGQSVETHLWEGAGISVDEIVPEIAAEMVEAVIVPSAVVDVANELTLNIEDVVTQTESFGVVNRPSGVITPEYTGAPDGVMSKLSRRLKSAAWKAF